MQPERRALGFDCAGARLVGVLDLPPQPHARGVLVIVGGPQYRAGSHRMFALLAADLAAQGYATLRFDYRGMGDSEGAPRGFEEIGDDIRAAIDAFTAAVPQVSEVVLWGLCDGASAALLYGARDARVAGLALLNPWARTDSGLAQATLKHYYGARLLDPDLWKKILSGRFNPATALRSLLALVRQAGTARHAQEEPGGADLPERLYRAWQAFDKPVLLMTSGADLTAQEFMTVAAQPRWQALLDAPQVTQRRLDGADHTCSRHAWREQVSRWCAAWLGDW